MRPSRHDCVNSVPRERERERMTIINFVIGRREITLIDPYVLSFRKSHSLVSFMRASRERPRAVDSDADADADVEADAGAARGGDVRASRTFSRPVHEVDRRGRRALDSSFPDRPPRAIPLRLYTVSPDAFTIRRPRISPPISSQRFSNFAGRFRALRLDI